MHDDEKNLVYLGILYLSMGLYSWRAKCPDIANLNTFSWRVGFCQLLYSNKQDMGLGLIELYRTFGLEQDVCTLTFKFSLSINPLIISSINWLVVWSLNVRKLWETMISVQKKSQRRCPQMSSKRFRLWRHKRLKNKDSCRQRNQKIFTLRKVEAEKFDFFFFLFLKLKTD